MSVMPGLEREPHLVAVEVIAVGHREARLERAIVERARGEAERLLRRQQLGVRLHRAATPSAAREADKRQRRQALSVAVSVAIQSR